MKHRPDTGAEPVRDWLQTLSVTDRKTIGENIKTVPLGWPLGMPLTDHSGGDIMVLLHAFIKK
ncbi:MAG: hypothetical protein HY777_02190 [Betaproteobacteria bacterium]|nr:hypothetical protein [Betaproteobacteria bacterium]